ncbi:MAG: hypothetical protein A2580_18115 [Hydrogenophilales bacterium RIFOXYD1_FULL_62_11]|nr:MAG: hypothetical protein A2580_18115 [Hydrogenophilales bacterium RIFOXYD1_FULL_62_11]
MIEVPFVPTKYELGIHDARKGIAPYGPDLATTDDSYRAGVLAGTRNGRRAAQDGLHWEPQALGRHLAGVVVDLQTDLDVSIRSLHIVAEQVLTPADVGRAISIATQHLQAKTA